MANNTQGQKERIAILGGGLALLVTAFEITNERRMCRSRNARWTPDRPSHPPQTHTTSKRPARFLFLNGYFWRFL